jgi:hypothetical protein
MKARLSSTTMMKEWQIHRGKRGRRNSWQNYQEARPRSEQSRKKTGLERGHNSTKNYKSIKIIRPAGEMWNQFWGDELSCSNPWWATVLVIAQNDLMAYSTFQTSKCWACAKQIKDYHTHTHTHTLLYYHQKPWWFPVMEENIFWGGKNTHPLMKKLVTNKHKTKNKSLSGTNSHN